MLLDSKAEHRLQRQRGAGARELASVQFGFTFGPAAAEDPRELETKVEKEESRPVKRQRLEEGDVENKENVRTSKTRTNRRRDVVKSKLGNDDIPGAIEEHAATNNPPAERGGVHDKGEDNTTTALTDGAVAEERPEHSQKNARRRGRPPKSKAQAVTQPKADPPQKRPKTARKSRKQAQSSELQDETAQLNEPEAHSKRGVKSDSRLSKGDDKNSKRGTLESPKLSGHGLEVSKERICPASVENLSQTACPDKPKRRGRPPKKAVADGTGAGPPATEGLTDRPVLPKRKRRANTENVPGANDDVDSNRRATDVSNNDGRTGHIDERSQRKSAKSTNPREKRKKSRRRKPESEGSTVLDDHDSRHVDVGVKVIAPGVECGPETDDVAEVCQKDVGEAALRYRTQSPPVVKPNSAVNVVEQVKLSPDKCREHIRRSKSRATTDRPRSRKVQDADSDKGARSSRLANPQIHEDDARPSKKTQSSEGVHTHNASHPALSITESTSRTRQSNTRAPRPPPTRPALSERADNVQNASARLFGVIRPSGKRRLDREEDEENDSGDLGAIMNFVGGVRVPESLMGKGSRDGRLKFKF